MLHNKKNISLFFPNFSYHIVALQFNKLRFQVSQTGRGRVSKKYHIKETEGKALDYLRSETVKGGYIVP